METMMEVERVVFKTNTKAIMAHEAQLTAKVNEACRILNEVNKVYSLADGVKSFPLSINDLILKLFLQRSKPARDMHGVKPLSLRDVSLPDDLIQMQSSMEAWQSFPHKEAVGYLIYKDWYHINQEMIEAEMKQVTELNRTYIQGEQVTRLGICNDMLRGVEYEVQKNGIDFNSDSVRASMLRAILQKNPWLTFIGYKLDGSGNKFQINERYVLTGSLDF